MDEPEKLTKSKVGKSIIILTAVGYGVPAIGLLLALASDRLAGMLGLSESAGHLLKTFIYSFLIILPLAIGLIGKRIVLWSSMLQEKEKLTTSRKVLIIFNLIVLAGMVVLLTYLALQY